MSGNKWPALFTAASVLSAILMELDGFSMRWQFATAAVICIVLTMLTAEKRPDNDQETKETAQKDGH